MTPAEYWTLIDAAAELRFHADLLRASHTSPPDYIWPDSESIAKGNHDRMMALAERVRLIAAQHFRTERQT